MTTESRWKRTCWPAISDLNTAKMAAMTGAEAAFVVAAITALYAVVGTLRISPLSSTSGLIYSVLAACLGLMIRKMSRVAAVAALVIFMVDRLHSALGHRISSGATILTILLTLALISGVRGTLAYHRYVDENPAKIA